MGGIDLARRCEGELPLEESYRARLCQGLVGAECEEELGGLQEWGKGMWLYANNLWGDASWWPVERMTTGRKLLQPSQNSPPVFQPPGNWSRELASKPGCTKYDFNWSAFDHLRAAYNTTGWTDRIPGVQQGDDGSFRIAAPKELEMAGVTVSCQLFGVWSMDKGAGGSETRKTASMARGDGVPFEVNGRRYYSQTRQNKFFEDDGVPGLQANGGRISDGPGDYGNYTEGVLEGQAIQLMAATYNPPAAPGEDGTVLLEFADARFSTLLRQTGLEAWLPGTKVRFLPAEVGAPLVTELAAAEAVIQQVNSLKRTVLVATPAAVTATEVTKIEQGAGSVARVVASVCFGDGGGCVMGNYTGTRCAWEIQAPVGHQVKLELKMMDLVPDADALYLYDVSDLDTESEPYTDIMRGERSDRQPLAVISGNSSLKGSPAHAALASNYRSRYGGRMLVVLNTRGGNGNKQLDTSGGGFDAEFFFVPRLADMVVSDTPYTNLQYAMGFLEYQQANVSALSASADVEQLFVTGNGFLGPITVAERCFVTCSGLLPYYPHPKRTHTDPVHLPVWHRRPPREDVGRDSRLAASLVTEVQEWEIPAAVKYMGYGPEHFVRTGYVSRFPPGSFKAPSAVRIGEIPAWLAGGDADPSLEPQHQPTRASIGWGLQVMYVPREEEGAVWGDGWGAPEGDRAGKQWWDVDGANGELAPAWHVLAPAGAPMDGARFAFDLVHPDLALYAFVDSQRRLVMANTLAQAVGCGQLVNSSCDVSCEIPGTGLNMMQCTTRAKRTRCGQPVVDECNNECGIKGTDKCPVSAVALGSLRIGTTGQRAASAYVLGVGRGNRNTTTDNALYFSHEQVSAAGVTQEEYVATSHSLNIVKPSDSMVAVFSRQALTARLNEDSKTLQIVTNLLKGSALQQLEWSVCLESPPGCGAMQRQPPGWITAYQVTPAQPLVRWWLASLAAAPPTHTSLCRCLAACACLAVCASVARLSLPTGSRSWASHEREIATRVSQ